MALPYFFTSQGLSLLGDDVIRDVCAELGCPRDKLETVVREIGNYGQIGQLATPSLLFDDYDAVVSEIVSFPTVGQAFSRALEIASTVFPSYNYQLGLALLLLSCACTPDLSESVVGVAGIERVATLPEAYLVLYPDMLLWVDRGKGMADVPLRNNPCTHICRLRKNRYLIGGGGQLMELYVDWDHEGELIVELENRVAFQDQVQSMHDGTITTPTETLQYPDLLPVQPPASTQHDTFTPQGVWVRETTGSTSSVSLGLPGPLDWAPFH